MSFRFAPLLACVALTASALAGCALTPAQKARQACSDHTASGDQVIAACSAVLQEPNLPKDIQGIAYYNRGVGYLLKGQYDTSITDFTQAIAIRPDYAEAYENRGTALAKQGRWDAAIPDLTEAISLNPSLPHVHFNRGLSYEAKGINAQAISDYRAELKIDPDSKEASNRLAGLGGSP